MDKKPPVIANKKHHPSGYYVGNHVSLSSNNPVKTTPLPFFENGGNRMSDESDQNESASLARLQKSEANKLRCFMGCSVTLFFVTTIIQIITMGFVIVIWIKMDDIVSHSLPPVIV